MRSTDHSISKWIKQPVHVASLAIFEDLNLAQERGETHGNLRDLYLDQGRVEDARTIAELSLLDFVAIDNKNRIAKDEFVLGNINFKLGDLPEALEHFEISRLQFQSLDLKRQEVVAIVRMSAVHTKSGAFQEAALLLQESLQISRELGDNALVVNSARNLGRTYFFLKEMKKARAVLREAVPAALELEDKNPAAEILDLLIGISQQEGNLRAVVFRRRQALPIYKALGHIESLSAAYNDIANLHLRQGELRQGEEASKKALAASTESGDSSSIAVSYANLGRSNFLLGNLPEAKEFYLAAQGAHEGSGEYWEQFEKRVTAELAAIDLKMGSP